jgi:hypothetical protein
MIRRQPAKASRLACQTASDHRERRYRYARWARCCSSWAGARMSPRALLPPDLRHSLEIESRESQLESLPSPGKFSAMGNVISAAIPWASTFCPSTSTSAHYEHARLAVESGVAAALKHACRLRVQLPRWDLALGTIDVRSRRPIKSTFCNHSVCDALSNRAS